MIAVRLLWLAVLLVAIPAWVGNCFLNVDKPCRNPVFLWISGQMLLWAGFQVICVPVILLEGRMWMVTAAYCGFILVLLAAGAAQAFPIGFIVLLVLGGYGLLSFLLGKKQPLLSRRSFRRRLMGTQVMRS